MLRSRVSDRVLLWTLRSAAALAGSAIVLVVAFVVWESIPVLTSVGAFRFLADPSWQPGEGRFDLKPMVAATLLVSGGAILLAGPLGLASALFTRQYAPPVAARLYRRIVELLAGVPSVVYGFWGLVVLVPLIARLQPPGPSLLAGILILALMILPTVALTADAALEGVESEYARAAAALGLTRWTVSRRVLLPAARDGIGTGVILALGRAVGETMAVLMVCGNVVQVPASVFDPVRTLTANIALEMAYALGDHRSALFLGGLVLLLMVAALVAGAGLLGDRSRSRA